MVLKAIERKMNWMVLPSTGKKVKYSGLTAGKEFEISLAKTEFNDVVSNLQNNKPGKDMDRKIKKATSKLMLALLDIYVSCFVDVDKSKITEKDFEMMLVELKKTSVDNVLDIYTHCEKCGGHNKITYNLDNIKINKSMGEVEYNIPDTDVILVIGEAPLESTLLVDDSVCDEEDALRGLASCIKRVIIDNESVAFSDISINEQVKWIKDNLLSADMVHITDILSTNVSGFVPIELYIKSCNNDVNEYGDYISPKQIKAMADMVSLQKHTEDDNTLKFKKCGHSYMYKVDNLIQYFL